MKKENEKEKLGDILFVPTIVVLIFVVLHYYGESHSLQKKHEKLQKENRELKEENKTLNNTLDSLREMWEPNNESNANDVKPHIEDFLELFPDENNVLKVGDKLPLSSGLGGGYNEKAVPTNEGLIYTIDFNKGRKAYGIDGGITYIYTSPTGATVYLDTDRRITEIEGTIYKSRFQ